MISSCLAGVLLCTIYSQVPPIRTGSPIRVGVVEAPTIERQYLIDSIAYLVAKNPPTKVRLLQLVQLTDESIGMLLLTDNDKILTHNVDQIPDHGPAQRHKSTKLRNHEEAVALAKAMQEFGISMPMYFKRIPDKAFWRYHVRYYSNSRVSDRVWAIRKSDLKLYRNTSYW